jgi:hypothetical protein
MCERRLWECLGVEGRIILKGILKSYDEKCWSGFIWFAIRTGECDNCPSGSINAGNFLNG